MIHTCYFSPCGNVRKIVTTIGETLAQTLGTDLAEHDFTSPASRQQDLKFTEKDLVILGTPVYASRVPNKIMPYIKEHILGQNTPVVLITSYGNRSYGDALSEQKKLALENGFLPIAAAAIVSEHSFAETLATGRPNIDDIEEIYVFSTKLAEKIETTNSSHSSFKTIQVPGDPDPQAYYTPLKEDLTPARFLKAVPVVNPDKCRYNFNNRNNTSNINNTDNHYCKHCVNVCPMGSIDPENPALTVGICIKCQACIKACPVQARSFQNEDFLSHRNMLMQNHAEPKQNQYYL